jgi:transcriptional regulator with XRE-family HTH domain
MTLARHHLRAYRKLAGMSQECLADRIEKCTATVWRYENDLSGIPQRVLERIAKVLNTTPGAILDYSPLHQVHQK